MTRCSEHFRRNRIFPGEEEQASRCWPTDRAAPSGAKRSCVGSRPFAELRSGRITQLYLSGGDRCFRLFGRWNLAPYQARETFATVSQA
jgi:hypothetical protein